jgi:hypothetical protein
MESAATAQIYAGLGPFGHLLLPGGGGFARFDSKAVQSFHADAMVHDAIRAGVIPPEMRHDAGLSLAFAREFEYVVAKVYEVEYPQFRATDFIPVDTSVPPGALTFTYRRVDIGAGGHAKIVNAYADDLPRADINASELHQPIVTIASSYEFSVVDIAAAAFSGIPIEAYKARAARFAIDFLMERLACFGYAPAGLVGLSNAPGIIPTTKISTGTWVAQIAGIVAATAAAPYTATAVVSAIAGDVAALLNKVFIQTNGTHAVDTILVDVPTYAALKTMVRSPVFTYDTILQYLEQAFDVTFDYWPMLGTAGVGSTPGAPHGRVMAYKKDEDLLKLVISQPFTQLPPQPVNLAFQVPCMERTGAVQVMSPLSMTYMDGCS